MATFFTMPTKLHEQLNRIREMKNCDTFIAKLYSTGQMVVGVRCENDTDIDSESPRRAEQ